MKNHRAAWHLALVLSLTGFGAACTAVDAASDDDEDSGAADATVRDIGFDAGGVRDIGVLDTGIADAGGGADAGGDGSDAGVADGSGGGGEGVCGDGVLDTGEECDDGNRSSGDGCEADCTLPEGGRALCEPCDSSAQCGGPDDYCITVAGGAACGLDCANDGPCPTGYECRFNLAVEGSDGGPQCFPVAGFCGECDDADDDGVCDELDACPDFDDTIDGDGDGQPDDCDPCPADRPDDSDGDGVCNSDDVCADGDDTADRDGDDVPDACDPCPEDIGTEGCDPPPAEICDNGTDDDLDSRTDCADSDCADDPACAPDPEVCDNGTDDDGDSAIDCDDSDCADDPACVPVGGVGTCAEPFRATLGENIATPEVNEQEPSCQSNDGNEIVFAFTPTLGQVYCADTTGSGVLDTIMSVRTTCGDPGSETFCLDDAEVARPGGSALSAWATLEATTSDDVYFIVDAYNDNVGDVRFTITEGACGSGPVDPGDLPFDGEGFETCADPFLISAYGEYSGPAFADDDDGSCSSISASKEAVIAFLAPETTTVCASTAGSPTTDTVVYVRTSCDASSELACSDDAVDLWGQVEFAAEAGNLYYVFLEEYSSGAFTDPLFNYAITAGPCP